MRGHYQARRAIKDINRKPIAARSWDACPSCELPDTPEEAQKILESRSGQ